MVLLMRSMPKKSNISVYDWSIALLGSFVILFTRPAPQVNDQIVLLCAQLFGMGISLAGLFSLNKSFGLVAANRGVKTSGMYAIVRHPIYAGYFLSFGAYLIQNMTLANAVIYTVFVAMGVAAGCRGGARAIAGSSVCRLRPSQAVARGAAGLLTWNVRHGWRAPPTQQQARANASKSRGHLHHSAWILRR
jgi:hypothetical protein